jgi:glycosyltransferase involved in cell wall biosynthesis
MKFSVLISVYYKEKAAYLHECFQSLLDQTVKPAEIVLVKDGALSDDLEEVIKKWQIEFPANNIEFIVISLAENSGLPVALNLGIKSCSFNYIARMDSDDICIPDRFEKQFAVLEKDAEIALLGGQVAEFDEEMKNPLGYRYVPLSNVNIVKFSRWRSPFNHPSVIFKKNVVLAVGGYPEQLRNWQDYALWGKILAKGYKACNVPEIVIHMRTGDSLFTRRSGLKYLKYEIKAYNIIFKSGLIKRSVYYPGLIIKILIRLLPRKLLSKIYSKFLRKNNLLI